MQVSGTPRALLRLEGGAALVASVLAYSAVGGSWTWFALLLLAPDVSMLGYLRGARAGAALYNAAHTYLSPAALALVGSMAGLAASLPIALVWTAHIGIDRLLGYGLKYPTAFRATHLDLVGQRQPHAQPGNDSG